jgi:predicted ATPase
MPTDRDEELRAGLLTEALAQHSLVQLDPAADGPRCRMLETVRVFVAERLAARPDAAEVRRRHAGYYRALAGRAEPHLRGAGQTEWLDRLQAEAGNLAAAVDWYLSHDRAPLPHLFRALLPYWLWAGQPGSCWSTPTTASWPQCGRSAARPPAPTSRTPRRAPP